MCTCIETDRFEQCAWLVTQWIVLVWVEALRSVTGEPGGSWTLAVYLAFSGGNAFQTETLMKSSSCSVLVQDSRVTSREDRQIVANG